MTPSLERLAELVRQAETKFRVKKLDVETQHAAKPFRVAGQRAAHRLREVRPVRLRELEQAEADEHHLKDLIRKLAQFKFSLDSDALISNAQAEIERKRKEAQAELEAVGRESDEARRELRTSMDHYQQLRRELDRLQPQLADNFSNEDRLLWDAEVHFPGGQFQALAREVEASVNYFGVLSKLEQYSQLKIWIGRFRMHQAANDSEITDENQTLSQRVFHQLKTLSKQYEPGYIEAFRHDFHTDYPAYNSGRRRARSRLASMVEPSRDATGASLETSRVSFGRTPKPWR